MDVGFMAKKSKFIYHTDIVENTYCLQPVTLKPLNIYSSIIINKLDHQYPVSKM